MVHVPSPCEGYDTTSMRLPYGVMYTLASGVQAVLGGLNFFRRLIWGKKTKSWDLTFSPSRLCIAATAHWYCIDAARRELGYAPLWSLKEGLFLSLQTYASKRCERPSVQAVERARKGNLITLGLVRDPDTVSDSKTA